MKLQLWFKGDYAREFGAHPKGYSRVWKVYHLIDNDKLICCKVEEEPDYTDGSTYFLLWRGEDYLGKFKTRKDLYKSVKKLLKEKQLDYYKQEV